MYHSKDAVALCLFIHQHAQCEQVVDFTELLALRLILLDLAVRAVDVLGAPRDIGPDTLCFQAATE